MNKVLWIDTETTNLDEFTGAIIQIGGLVQIDGKIVETFNITINPGDNVVYEQEALDKHNITKEEIATYPDEFVSHNEFMNILDKYIDRYDKTDKFIMAGYNTTFDRDFLLEFFKRNQEEYFFSYFHGAVLDVMTLCVVATSNYRTQVLKYTLEAMCILFEVALTDAHDALADIVATFKLHKTIMRDYLILQGS